MNESGGNVAESHDESRIADDGADERRFDERNQALLNSEYADEKVGRVAEGGIEKPAYLGSQPVGERLG